MTSRTFPCIQRPQIVPGCTRFVDPTQTKPLFYNGVEHIQSGGHWMFGTDNPTYSDATSGQLLTLLDVGHPPTLSSGYMSLSASGSPPGLRTPYADSADMTVAMVFRQFSSMGNMFDSWNASLTRGKSLFCGSFADGANPVFIATGVNNTTLSEVRAPTVPQPVSPGTWAFVMMSFSSANGGSAFVYYGGGLTYYFTGVSTPSAVPPVLGAVGNLSPAFSALIVAELIIDPLRGWTPWEAVSLYSRRKTWLGANRGITVV